MGEASLVKNDAEWTSSVTLAVIGSYTLGVRIFSPDDEWVKELLTYSPAIGGVVSFAWIVFIWPRVSHKEKTGAKNRDLGAADADCEQKFDAFQNAKTSGASDETVQNLKSAWENSLIKRSKL